MSVIDIQQLRLSDELFGDLKSWSRSLSASVDLNDENASDSQLDKAVSDIESFNHLLIAIVKMVEAKEANAATVVINPVKFIPFRKGGREYLRIKERALAIIFEKIGEEWIYKHLIGSNGEFISPET